MDKKSTRILLSILHVCILGICILTIYSNKHSGDTVVHVSYDTKTAVTPRETVEEPEEPEESVSAAEESKPVEESDKETAEEPEESTGTAEEVEPEPEMESEPETSTEVRALYSFRFIGTKNKLNVRSAPSMDAEIIGKVPVGGSGSVLELTDEEWVCIEYDGTVGYCSREWIELQEITE